MTSDLYQRWLPIVGTVGARLAIVAAGVGTSIITARALGAEGRGAYYAVVTLAGIIAQFANLGLSSSNTILAARMPHVRERLLANTMWVVLAAWFTGLLVVAAGGALLASHLSVSPQLMFVAATLAPCILFTTLGGALLIADERFDAVNGWQLFNALAVVSAMLLCRFLRADATGFVCATTLAAIATAAGMWRSLRGRVGALIRFDRGLFRDGLSFAARAYIAVLAGFMIQRTAASVLLTTGDLNGLGVLSVATQLHDVLLILPTSVGMVLFPRLIKNDAGAWRATREALVATLALITAGCLLAAVLGRTLLPLVFGRAFIGSYWPMVGLLPAVLSISAVSVLSQYVVAREFPIRLVLVWVAGLGLTSATAPGLYRAYGIDGVVWAQSAGSLFVLAGVAALAIARRRHERCARHAEVE